MGCLVKMKKQKFKIGSVISGIGLGVLLGVWVNYIYSFQYSQFIYISIGILIFGLAGYYKQKPTEVLAYALSIYVFLQMFWDYSVGDRGPIRMSLLLSAVILLIVNILTGHYGLKQPQKILKQAIGI